jgi:hypothetical protein
MNLPFKEINKKNKVIRKFSSDTDDQDLRWHYDLEDRIIIPIKENDWLFQEDNKLPKKLNKKFFIKAGEWHRVIKGTTDLLLEIIFK